MIQFNLLPDVKLEFIKATYRRRIITLFCIIASGVFITIFILMFLFVRVNQTGQLSDLDKDITTNVDKLRNENKDLDKILTIQNQLDSLPGLHDDKVIGSRVFDYLTQVTPNQASVTNVEVDFGNQEVSIKGVADNLSTVNKFVDTLKFTDYKVEDDDSKSGKAFNSVVLQSFRLDSATASGGEDTVSYEIVFKYEPVIFESTAVNGDAVKNKVKLTVPSIITTRSETQKPKELFNATTQTEEGGDQ